MNSDQIKTHVRGAYEKGRLIAASRLLWVVVPIVILSLYTCGGFEIVPLVIGCVLAITVVALKWRGQEYGFAVGPGLIAGIIGFTIPLVLHILGICCRNNLEIVFCGLSGVIAGIVVGKFIGQSRRQHRSKSFLIALFIAALTAALGCMSLEIGAIVGLFVALLGSSISSFSVFQRQKRSLT